MGRPATPLTDRFWRHVDKDGPVPAHCPEIGPCWIWTQYLTSEGYGRSFAQGRRIDAHRVAFFLANGRWAAPCTCHRCDNRACVRPDHLFEGSYSDNNRDTSMKGRQNLRQSKVTHCPKGHAYDLKNTIMVGRNRRSRGCRTCRVEVYSRRAAAHSGGD